MTEQTIMDKIKVGQLLSMEWKLGVALKSKNCAKLNSPFVTLHMTTMDSAMKKTSWCFELTIPEFKNFAKQVNDCYHIMDSL